MSYIGFRDFVITIHQNLLERFNSNIYLHFSPGTWKAQLFSHILRIKFPSPIASHLCPPIPSFHFPSPLLPSLFFLVFPSRAPSILKLCMAIYPVSLKSVPSCLSSLIPTSPYPDHPLNTMNTLLLYQESNHPDVSSCPAISTRVPSQPKCMNHLQAQLCPSLQDILFFLMLIEHWKTISASWMTPSKAVATL